MRGFTSVIACLMITTLLSSTNAQTSTAQIDISCTPEEVFLDSFPDSPNNTTIVNCILTNPTSSEEKIEFTGSGDDVFEIFLINGDEFTIAAGESINANVSISIAEGTKHATYSLSFTAVVTEVNGVPPANTAEKSVNVLGTVNQYESYVASYDSPLSFTIGGGGGEYTGSTDGVIVSNNGNHESMISMDVTDLRNDLFAHKLYLMPLTTTYSIPSSNSSKLEFMVFESDTSPVDLSNSSWELIGENGTKKLSITSSIRLQGSSNATCYGCTTVIEVNIEVYSIHSSNEKCAESALGDEVGYVENIGGQLQCNYYNPNWDKEVNQETEEILIADILEIGCVVVVASIAGAFILSRGGSQGEDKDWDY